MCAGFTDQGLAFANPDGSRCHPETMSRSCKESQAACLPAQETHMGNGGITPMPFLGAA